MANAVGVAFGTIKPQDFKDFLEQLTMKEKSTEKTVSQIKTLGIPFEEH